MEIYPVRPAQVSFQCLPCPFSPHLPGTCWSHLTASTHVQFSAWLEALGSCHSWEQPSTNGEWKLENTPASWWVRVGRIIPRHIPHFLWGLIGIEASCPQQQPALSLSHPVFIPGPSPLSFPHSSTSVSWDRLPNKLLAWDSLIQGLLLGTPSFWHPRRLPLSKEEDSTTSALPWHLLCTSNTTHCGLFCCMH